MLRILSLILLVVLLYYCDNDNNNYEKNVFVQSFQLLSMIQQRQQRQQRQHQQSLHNNQKELNQNQHQKRRKRRNRIQILVLSSSAPFNDDDNDIENDNDVNNNDDDSEVTLSSSLLPVGVEAKTTSISQSSNSQSSTSSISNYDKNDLTDRFKYKVQALMGSFDPLDESNDTEINNNSNIINALVTFPIVHTFTVIGITNNDPLLITTFTQQVQDTIQSITGDINNNNNDSDSITIDDDSITKQQYTCTVTPRGTKYTKVSIQCIVYNATMITSIYAKLKTDIQMSIMQF